VDENEKTARFNEEIRRAMAGESGGATMSGSRAITFMGEGYSGVKRMESTDADPFSWMDHTPIDIEPIGDGTIERQMLPENQRFLADIRRDIQAGRLNPAKILSGGRQKSP